MYKKLVALILTLLLGASCSTFAAEITLQWSMNTEPGVKEYKLFKRIGTATGYDYDAPYAIKQHADCGQIAAGKCEVIVGVSDQNILRFIVRAYDDVNRASSDSNEVIYNPTIGPNFLSFTWLDAKIYNYPVYFGTTDKSITVNWSAYPDAIGYDYVLYDIFKKVDTSVSGYVTITNATFQLPATGSYEVMIRAKRSDQTYDAWVTLQGRYVGWPGGAGGIVIGRSLQKPNIEKEYIDSWRPKEQKIDYTQNFLK